MSKAPDILVSDADRERVAEQLRQHYESGRLTLEEFQERLDEAHAARTESALAEVLRQLPSVTPMPSVRPRDTRWRSLAVQYVLVNLVALLVWAFGGAQTHDFWPKWVLLGTLILFARRVMGPRHGHHHRPPLPPPPPRPPEL